MRLCRGSLCTFNRAVHPPSTKVNVSLFLVTFHSHEPKVLLSQNVRLVEKPVGWNWGSRGKTDITRPTQRHKPLDRLCPKPTNPVQIGGCETVVKLDTLNIFILGTRRVFPLPAISTSLHVDFRSSFGAPFYATSEKKVLFLDFGLFWDVWVWTLFQNYRSFCYCFTWVTLFQRSDNHLNTQQKVVWWSKKQTHKNG